MKKFIYFIMAMFMPFFMVGCVAEKSYTGKVNVVAIGAGPKPTDSFDRQYIKEDYIPNAIVGYTPNLFVSQQSSINSMNYIMGDGVRTYSGEPKLLVDYLNSYQKLDNKVFIIDKNGVVAWSANFSTNIIGLTKGVDYYDIYGENFINFDQAMQRYVFDEQTTDFDDTKQHIFPEYTQKQYLYESDYQSKYPMLFTKLPDMKIYTSKGELSLSKIMSNNKPTILFLFISQKNKNNNLEGEMKTAADMFNAMKDDASNQRISPQQVLRELESTYFIQESK